MTKFFKNKSKKQIKSETNVPRENSDILKDYTAAKARAGEVQYLLYAYEKELARLNQILEGLNYESEARKNLDAQNQSVQPVSGAV